MLKPSKRREAYNCDSGFLYKVYILLNISKKQLLTTINALFLMVAILLRRKKYVHIQINLKNCTVARITKDVHLKLHQNFCYVLTLLYFEHSSHTLFKYKNSKWHQNYLVDLRKSEGKKYSILKLLPTYIVNSKCRFLNTMTKYRYQQVRS